MKLWLALFVAACLLAVSPAAALTDEEVFRDFRFNLINPGRPSFLISTANPCAPRTSRRTRTTGRRTRPDGGSTGS